MDAPAIWSKAAPNPDQIQLGLVGHGPGTCHGCGDGLPIGNIEALAMGVCHTSGALETFAYMALAICWLLLVRGGRATAVFQFRDPVGRRNRSLPCRTSSSASAP